MILLGEMQLSEIKTLEAQVNQESKSEDFYQEALSKLWVAYTSMVNEGKLPGVEAGLVAKKSEGLRRMVMVEEEDAHVIYLINSK